MINTYKAMGGGWIALAEEMANTVDFPPEDQTDSGHDTTRGGSKTK
jgi:hypothetical protein